MGPGPAGAALGMGGVVPGPARRTAETGQSRGQPATSEITQLSHGEVSLSRLFGFLPEGLARLSFTVRIERPPLYRGGSASKKDGRLLPPPALRVKKPRAIVAIKFSRESLANTFHVSRFTFHGGYDA